MTRYDYLRSTHRCRLRSFFLRHRDTEVDGDRNAFISHGSWETKKVQKKTTNFIHTPLHRLPIFITRKLFRKPTALLGTQDVTVFSWRHVAGRFKQPPAHRCSTLNRKDRSHRLPLPLLLRRSGALAAAAPLPAPPPPAGAAAAAAIAFSARGKV